MKLTANNTSTGSFIYLDSNTIYKVLSMVEEGAMTVKQVKTTGNWTKKPQLFEFGEYSQIKSITN